MTREALRALPEPVRAHLPPESELLLVDTCCMNPDRYFDIAGGGHERVRPYTLLIDGIQFHYLPNTSIEAEYKYWGVARRADGERVLRRVRVDPNDNWRHAWAGFNHYIGNSVENLRAGRLDDAMNYIGILLHTLQDASTFLHSLEGPNGADLFVLDRLMDTPAGRFDLLPTSVLRGRMTDFDIVGYAPALLGVTVPEAAFRLYSGYARTVMSNRRKLIPMLHKSHEGDEAGVDALSADIMRCAARLSADAVYTIFCQAFNHFLQAETDLLRAVYLSDLMPVREPRGLSMPYRFISWLPDAALDQSLKPRPLRIELDGSCATFSKGIASGSHFDYTFAWELPPAVYARLSGAVGLHPDLSRHGDFVAQVALNGQVLFRSRITDAHPGDRFECATNGGGLLELQVECAFGMGNAGQCVNNIVWGDLKLTK